MQANGIFEISPRGTDLREPAYLNLKIDRIDNEAHFAVTGPGFTFNFTTPAGPVKEFLESAIKVCESVNSRS